MNESLGQLNLNREEEILSSRIEDLFLLCDRNNIPKFTGFLDLHQQKISQYTASGFDASAFELFGGIENAERKMFGVFPDYIYDRYAKFPIGYLEITHSRPLTHRDFLGSLMSLGIKREVVGDIIVGENKSYIVIQKAICSYVIENVSKIGNVGVSIKECSAEDIVCVQNRFEQDTVIVSSMRLDCVIAALSNKSRSDATKFITSERVSVNHEIIVSVSKNLNQGDVISIRSVGKFVIGDCVAKTKKGRLVLSYKKYI